MKTKILIVEDDADFGNLLKQYLELNSFEVFRVYNCEEAMKELKINLYDLLIIDVMMPIEDGFSFAAKIRQYYPRTPFLFVTARKMKEDIIHGLKLGADDYVLKPFDADELILRMQNILKRVYKKADDPIETITIGIYLFDPKNLKLTSPKAEKILTDKESRLLHYLCQHQGQLIKRNEILDFLWNDTDFFKGRSMDVFISRLRKYLSEDQTVHIESIRGVGFRFLF